MLIIAGFDPDDDLVPRAPPSSTGQGRVGIRVVTSFMANSPLDTFRVLASFATKRVSLAEAARIQARFWE